MNIKRRIMCNKVRVITINRIIENISLERSFATDKNDRISKDNRASAARPSTMQSVLRKTQICVTSALAIVITSLSRIHHPTFTILMYDASLS